MNKIAVIGGGASGMVAAIRAAAMGGAVTIYEKNERVGQKILATGNGKCNLSNMEMDQKYFHTSHPYQLVKMLHKFSVADTITFFAWLGLMVREKGAHLYPYSEQASAVLDVLRFKLADLDVKVICGCEIETVKERENGMFLVGGELYEKVIVACGSRAWVKKGDGRSGYKIAEGFGHSLAKVVPGLCKLKCREGFLKGLAGVRCQAQLTMVVNGSEKQYERGELQFTKDALSGIPIFELSRNAAYALEAGDDVAVLVNFFPEMNEGEYEAFCRARYDLDNDRSIADFLVGMTNKKINQAMIRLSGLKADDLVDTVDYRKIFSLLKGYRQLKFTVTETDSFENAQVCAGGVTLLNLSENMESRLVPGLYFVGEIVDVDGRCGGYNLQWAWTSGYLAGTSAALESDPASCYYEKALRARNLLPV